MKGCQRSTCDGLLQQPRGGLLIMRTEWESRPDPANINRGFCMTEEDLGMLMSSCSRSIHMCGREGEKKEVMGTYQGD
jgi:hypothetical protein